MSGGIMAYTASAPVNARVRDFSSVTFAVNASPPRLVNAVSFLLSRPTTRTFFFWPNSKFATTEPVCPVAPRITYIVSSLVLPGCWFGCQVGWMSYRLNHGNFYMVLFCKSNRFRISRIHVPHHAHPGIIRQHTLDALRHFPRPVSHAHLSGMLRISDPHSASIVNRNPRRPTRCTNQRVQQRPIRNRIRSI